MGTSITFLTNDDEEVMWVSGMFFMFYQLTLCSVRYDLKQGVCQCKGVIRLLIVVLQRSQRVPSPRSLLSWPSMRLRNTVFLGR